MIDWGPKEMSHSFSSSSGTPIYAPRLTSGLRVRAGERLGASHGVWQASGTSNLGTYHADRTFP